MPQTKIVATIGPASSSPDVLGELIDAGASVLRLNFSHGEHADHARVIETARRLAEEKGRPIALLQDLSGPKIRTRSVKDGAVQLETGARLTVTTERIEGTSERIATTYELLPDDVSPGDTILLDDGNLELRVKGVSGREVECEVVQGGELRSRKGMNLPGVKLSTPAITDKDRQDLRFGVAQGVDFVALNEALERLAAQDERQARCDCIATPPRGDRMPAPSELSATVTPMTQPCSVASTPAQNRVSMTGKLTPNAMANGISSRNDRSATPLMMNRISAAAITASVP